MAVDAATMEILYAETLKNFTEGSIVSGKILCVDDGDVLIDIGYKSEGIVPANEFNDLKEDPIGQEVEVFLEKLEDEHGMIVLSKRRAVQQRAWDYVVNECEEGSLVTGTIKAIVKSAKSGNIGDGKIFVMPMDDCIRIRTDETGRDAIG